MLESEHAQATPQEFHDAMQWVWTCAAQKIADQQTVNKAQKEIIDAQSKELSKYLNQIAEQAKEIERLTVMCKQEDAQIIALVKERDEARTVADEWREKAGSKYDPHPWEKQ